MIDDGLHMAQVYEYEQDFAQFQFFVFEKVDESSDFRFAQGSLLSKWKSPTPSVMKQHLKYKQGDFRNFGMPPLIVSQRAKDVLGKVVGKAVEWLPMKYQDESFFVMNVLQMADCVDLDKTKFSKNGTTRKLFFLPDRLAPLTVFQVPQAPGQWATDRFKEAVESAGLQGLAFKSVWKG